MTEIAISIDYGVIDDARGRQRRRQRCLALIGVLAVTAAGLAFTTRGPAQPDGRGPSQSGSPAPVVAANPTFAAFNRPSPIAMPAQLRAELSTISIETQKFAPNFALAHLLSDPAQTPQIWLVPGTNSLCLYTISVAANPVNDDGGSTCQSLPAVGAGELETYRAASNGASITGIAPDGVDHVTEHDPDGTTEQFPVRNNLFVVPDPATTTVALDT
ncbi:MAG TPA: hypothetical protein VIJ51_08545 [Solirubrobacteraceae bacterium]